MDDDPSRKDRDVRGIRVLGHCGQIPEVAAHTGADLVAIAIPSASTVQMRRIVESCERSNVPMQTVPRTRNHASAHATLDELRDVSIEDLLNREPARLDWPGMRKVLTARTVLVPGGGGSIGSELCRQIARLDPSCLVIMDISEFNLYRLELELRETYPELASSIMLTDVCDAAAVERVFERYRPEAVFHAFEELSHPIEPLGQTRHEKILLARHRRLLEHDGFAARLAELRRACDAFDEPALERIVAELAPEYLHGPSPSAEDVVPIGLAKR